MRIIGISMFLLGLLLCTGYLLRTVLDIRHSGDPYAFCAEAGSKLATADAAVRHYEAVKDMAAKK